MVRPVHTSFPKESAGVMAELSGEQSRITLGDRIVECVPNFSEGRRGEVVEAIVASIAAVPGVKILDYSMDPDYNRSVVTFAAAPEAAVEAAFQGIRKAAELIDMEVQSGEHPRIGAADVVPFVPIKGVSMEECVEMARQLGERVARELAIPVYLYEEAAARPERRNLENIRKGEYEGLKAEITLPERRPDYGEPKMHPSAGAVVIGARMPLVAYNVTLGTSDVSIARKIAKAVRASWGGLVYVKAIGVTLKERSLVQVSMNLTNHYRTPIYRAIELVRVEARRYGVPVVGSEIIGLVPLDAIIETAAYYLGLEGFSRNQVLEAKIWE